MPVKWLTREKCLRLLQKPVYGRLGTCGRGNQPYITPVNYVLYKERIYIHCAFTGRKLENLQHSSSVCFEVSSAGRLFPGPRARDFTMRFWSVLAFGHAKILDDPEFKLLIMQEFMRKYARNHSFRPLCREDMTDVNVLEISIEDISGKAGLDSLPQPLKD